MCVFVCVYIYVHSNLLSGYTINLSSARAGSDFEVATGFDITN